MKPVTVAAFNTREEAEPLRQFLCAAGVWAEVRTDTDTVELAHYDRPSAGVKVEVPREDFEAALGLVYEWNRDGKTGQTVSWRSWLQDGEGNRTQPGSSSGH